MKKHPALLAYIVFTALIFNGACKNDNIGSVDREDLFSLEIGPMEDQIALYRLDGERGTRHTGFTMRDGQFYISDGNSGKIVRFNSYGDLLFMIYNEETNPTPFSLRINIPEGEQATRWAYPYALEQPGWIAVDSRKYIYVEDRLPRHAQQFDQESGASLYLDGIILRFDRDGRYINYLGREGIGGSPFPRIIGLSTSVDDELAVICRIQNGWEIYWFNSSGMLLYYFKFSTSSIPLLHDWPEALSVVDNITASPDSRKIIIKVDYTRDIFDQSTNTRTGSQPISSIIWTLNVEDGTYANSIEVPLYEIIDNGRPTNLRVFYSLLGITHGGKALLYFPVETGYALLFIDITSQQHRRAQIQFSNEEIRYNDFFLSTEGILCAMLADNYNVKFVWWRTDRLMGDLL
jgi:hypothetical protein